GCSQNSEMRIRKQVTAIAEKYIMGQLTDSKKTVLKDGTIVFSTELKKYMIDPAKIFTGLIDDDQNIDAIVTLPTYDKQFQTVSEQLVILKADNEFKLAASFESDMRIISLKDRIITADVPEHSRSTPLFDCPSCWEVVKFQYRMGELVKAQ
ncbi:MAG TPA: hypothetical protein DEO60_08800, partial [Bacteroidales bacterium]|nr:hypothetical protein [Bacteroidales bacterium]